MHRWFFADAEIICKKVIPSPPTPAASIRTPSPVLLPDTLWKFTVQFKGNLCSNESVAICGSNDVLGNWNVQKCLPLVKSKDSPLLWTIEVTLPRSQNIRYRYLVCATNGRGQRIVRFWETHKVARLIRSSDEQDLESLDYETFGVIKTVREVQRGWVTVDGIVVQLKFYRAPFIFWAMKFTPLLYVKITPMKMSTQEKRCEKMSGTPPVESHAEKNDGQELKSTFAFCEVASLQEQNVEFRYQRKYGTSCGPDDMLMFNLTVGDFENTVYLIDLYCYPDKAAPDIPPYHFGYQYIYPQLLKKSDGTLKLNIMCATTHRPMGSITCDYLVVRPLNSHTFDLRESLQMPGKKKERKVLDIGHRGCGTSYWLLDNILRENTVDSFNVALEHGSDMIEFDVQLTKDKIPIIYHDFQLYISRNRNFAKEEYDILQLPLDKDEINCLKPLGRVLKSGLITLPLNQFTLDQLKRVKVYEIPEDGPRSKPSRGDNKLNLPFPTLEYILKELPKQLGFNIEIKWSQQLSDGSWEENFIPDCDKNEYVDFILEVVVKFASSRHIVFSSFDADICTMIRLKQNRFPVMFICNASTYEPKYLDPRGDSLLLSLYFASAMELYGIVADSKDIQRRGSLISNRNDRKIRLFAWGMDTRCEHSRKALRAVDVDGIIFDRINHVLNSKDLKQNIVLIELREKVKEISMQAEAGMCN